MRSIGCWAKNGLVASGLLMLVLVSPARSTSVSTDNSDLWAAHNEEAWGMQLVQRADVMFATLYVYDSQNQPTFYSATLYPNGMNAGGDTLWVGDLYLTHGPWFGAAFFDPQLVSYRKVDQLTYSSHFVDSATLSYTVDGLAVNKLIYRYTLRYDNYSGSYVGAYKLTQSQCFNPADNGIETLLGTFTVLSQSSSALTLVVNAYQGLTCNYPGDFQQFGQFGQSRGAFTCTDGRSGSYTFYEMNVTQTDVRGRVTGANNRGCVISGSFSALRQ